MCFKLSKVPRTVNLNGVIKLKFSMTQVVCPPLPSPGRHRERDDGADFAIHTSNMAICPPQARHPSAVIRCEFGVTA
ncbi:unnamed protein product [Pieris brassicae]|uniref:Uncharacterized protein n=1 Tax=Pieris brassicae TaxID=7116 RepID=A0A9P0TS21_PIEBR|nr:unnamed protein product [Pieris brassicae]